MLSLVFLFFIAEIDSICSKIIYFKIITFIAIFIVCSVPQFEASKYLVTNKEFFAFVKSGGYSTENLWSTEGRYMYVNV